MERWTDDDFPFIHFFFDGTFMHAGLARTVYCLLFTVLFTSLTTRTGGYASTARLLDFTIPHYTNTSNRVQGGDRQADRRDRLTPQRTYL